MQENLFYRHRGVSSVHKISYTGVFLALALLLQFVSKYMPFGDTYIKFNFSLLFILPIFYYAGPRYGATALLTRFALGPAISQEGYALMFVTGHFILMLCSIIAISLMYLFSLVFRNVKNHNIKVIWICTATVFVTSIVLTVLNQIFFTPLYWYVFDYIKHVSISEAIKTYAYVKFNFFMISNYWLGTFAVYFSGNLIKFGIIYILYFPMSKVLRHLHPTIAYGKNNNAK